MALSEETLTRWRDALDLIQVVDDIFDEGDTQIIAETVNMLESIFSSHLSEYTEDEALRDMPTVLCDMLALRQRISAKESEEFIRYGKRVMKISAKTRTTEDATEYAHQLRLEGQLTWRMLDVIASSEDKAQIEYKELSKLLKKVSRAGNVLDSIFDLNTDSNNRLTSVEPTLRARYDMSLACLRDARYCARIIGFKALRLVKPIQGIYWARNS